MGDVTSSGWRASFQLNTCIMAEYISTLGVQYMEPKHGYVGSSKYWNNTVLEGVTRLAAHPLRLLGGKGLKTYTTEWNKERYKKRTIPPSQRGYMVLLL